MKKKESLQKLEDLKKEIENFNTISSLKKDEKGGNLHR
jgi:hypothetical protein